MLLGYTRVSTSEQAGDDRTSLTEQERVIRGMAMAMGIGQFDLTIYSDPGVSGSIALADRPEGGKLYADAKKGDTVVASKLDRLFRDALDAQNVYKEFKKRGVHLILYDMGVEPVTKDGMSKFFFTMLSAFADLERTRITERMMDGKAAKKRAGGHIGGDVPYGFKKIGSGRAAKLEPDETEQKIMKLVGSNLYKRAGGIHRILRSHGYRARSGKVFQIVQIQRLMARAELPNAP